MASSWWFTLVWHYNNEMSFLYILKCLYILAKLEAMHRKIRQLFKKHLNSKIFIIISPEKGILYICNEISYHELSEFIIIKAVGTAGYMEKGYEKSCIPLCFWHKEIICHYRCTYWDSLLRIRFGKFKVVSKELSVFVSSFTYLFLIFEWNKL